MKIDDILKEIDWLEPVLSYEEWQEALCNCCASRYVEHDTGANCCPADFNVLDECCEYFAIAAEVCRIIRDAEREIKDTVSY